MKTKHLVTIGGGILAGVGALMGLHLPLVVEGLFALAVGGGVSTGLALAQSGKGSSNLLTGPQSENALLTHAPEGLTSQEKEAINKAVNKITAIRNASTGVRAPNTARQIRKICDISDKIVQDFREDPRDIVHARTWLDVYLDQTLDMVQKYARLSQTGSRNLEAQRVLGEVEKTLQVIEVQTEELLQKLLHNDILGLDVNQQVIRDLLLKEKM